jgi:glycosyltransferase involved in cell wall biosynthesis
VRLVFVTQRVDSQHPALAATIPKIRALAERVDKVVVVAQSGRGEELPENARLETFDGPSRLVRGLRFERAIMRALPADGVVAHMIPLYVLLAAPLVRPRRIPLVLWFTHWKSTPLLRAAERAATAVVSVDRRSFPFESAKVRAIGHGIDVSEFPCVAARDDHTTFRVLALGRYSPAKGLPTIVEGVGEVEGAVLEIHGAALNELERRHRNELERDGVAVGDAVPRSEVPLLFARSDVLVNNMRAGAPDKVVYEAAASCLPVVASNPVFDELFDGLPLIFDRDDPGSLAERLRWLASLGADQRASIGQMLRERVIRRHSVESWADGVLEALA